MAPHTGIFGTTGGFVSSQASVVASAGNAGA